MNEDLTLKKQCELVHFQSSARSAKKSNDFFGFMWQFANKCRDIIIFEPVPRLNRVIEESIAYNHETKIKLMKKAVGDKVGVLTMLDNNNSNVVGSSTATGTVTVPVSTLDIELNDRQQIDFIKIDVEGFELNVLKGCVETIKKHAPLLLIELHPTFILQYGDNLIDVVDYVERLNYDITYYSFTEERRMSAVMRVVNRWLGNTGKVYHSKSSFLDDLSKEPALLSYYLLCKRRQ